MEGGPTTVQQWGSWSRRGSAYALAVILVLGVLGTIARFTIGGHHWLERYAFAIVLVLLVGGGGGGLRAADRLDRLPEHWFLSMAIGLFVLSRFLWIHFIPTQPLSDAAAFHSFAEVLSHFRPLAPDLLFFPAWGYPLFLGTVYNATGANIFAGQTLNVALGTISALLLYKLAIEIVGGRLGRVVLLLFLFWPNYLAFSSLLMSEHLALVFLLAFLLLLIRGTKATTMSRPQLIGAGVCLVCMLAVRPAYFVAAFCFVPALFLGQGPLMRRAGRLAIVVVVAAASYVAFYLGVEGVYQRSPTPSTVPLLMGTNYDHLGRWNEDDATWYYEIASSTSFAAANAYALRTAVERIRSDPLRFLKLMARKLPYLWEDDTYAVFESTQTLHNGSAASNLPQEVVARQSIVHCAYHMLLTLRAPSSNCLARISTMALVISQYYFLFVLIFGIIGAIYLARHDFDGRIAMVLVLLLATSALHMITEVQHRYRFDAQVLLLLVVAIGLAGRDRPCVLASPHTQPLTTDY